MSSRRLLVAALCLIVGVTGAGATWAAFSSTTQNSGNSLATGAAAPGHARVATGTYTGNSVNNRNIAVPFAPQLVIVKGALAQTAVARSITMTGTNSKPMAGPAALGINSILNLTGTGFTVGLNPSVNTIGLRYDWVAFESAAGVMQAGSYVGSGAARSFTGVGFSPEYAMVLPAGTGRAVSRASGQTTSFQFDADTGNAARITSLDGDGFSVGTSTDVNTAGQSYHWIAWNRRGGLSEMITYTGTGAAGLTAYTGFQPEYAIVRENDTTTPAAAHHRMASQPGNNSYPFSPAGLLTDSITSLGTVDVGLGTNPVANTNGSTHSLVAFKSRPYASGGCSAPGTQTVAANADSHVRQDNAGTNYGTTGSLNVRSRNGNRNRRAFVRFNLPAVPAGCSVAFAKLRLNGSASTAGRTLNVHTPSAAWTESGAAGITWTNQPGVTGNPQSAVAAAGWVEWPVTSQVRSQYTTNYGFRISDAVESESATSRTQTYRSREAGTNNPQLLITFQ